MSKKTACITWVCKNCAEICGTTANTHPPETMCSKDTAGYHNWVPVQVDWR